MPSVHTQSAMRRALVQFHQSTDSRTAAAKAWRAHDAQRSASAVRSEELHRPASEPSANVSEAAKAAHASIWNGIKEDYFWTRAVFNFNQLPQTASLDPEKPRSNFDAARTSHLGMTVGLAGKAICFLLVVALLPTIGLMRRGADWMLQYAERGVPQPPSEGEAVVAAQRRQALCGWAQRQSIAIQRPEDGRVPSQLAPATHPLCVQSAREWVESSAHLHFSGLTPAKLAQATSEQHMLLPALYRTLKVEALNELLGADVLRLKTSGRDIAVAAPSQPVNERAAIDWQVELGPVCNDKRQSLGPSLDVLCSTTLPAGRQHGLLLTADNKPMHLRVPVTLTARLQFTAIGDTVDADIEAMGVTVSHESDYPLWFPRREAAQF